MKTVKTVALVSKRKQLSESRRKIWWPEQAKGPQKWRKVEKKTEVFGGVHLEGQHGGREEKGETES